MDTNLEKTKDLVCTPGYIWGKWSEAANKRRAIREGENFREPASTMIFNIVVDVVARETM